MTISENPGFFFGVFFSLMLSMKHYECALRVEVVQMILVKQRILQTCRVRLKSVELSSTSNLTHSATTLTLKKKRGYLSQDFNQ